MRARHYSRRAFFLVAGLALLLPAAALADQGIVVRTLSGFQTANEKGVQASVVVKTQDNGYGSLAMDKPGTVVFAGVRVQSTGGADAGLIQAGWIKSHGPLVNQIDDTCGGLAEAGDTVNGIFLEWRHIADAGNPDPTYFCKYVPLPQGMKWGQRLIFTVKNRDPLGGVCQGNNPCAWVASYTKVKANGSPGATTCIMPGGNCTVGVFLGFDEGYAIALTEFLRDLSEPLDDRVPCIFDARIGTWPYPGTDPALSFMYQDAPDPSNPFVAITEADKLHDPTPDGTWYQGLTVQVEGGVTRNYVQQLFQRDLATYPCTPGTIY